ncbi:hypothetical protein ABPG74_003098 [Tetrahymena malaccensis]
MEYEYFYDREIKFDLQPKKLQPCQGEFEMSSQNYIEDFKGNADCDGVLVLTNLRLVWYQKDDKRINLSIGLDTVNSSDIKTDRNLKIGLELTLSIKAKMNKNKFEFIFKTKNGEPTNIFNLFQQVCRGYLATKIYRDLKRGAIIQDKTLQILPNEKVISKYPNVRSVGNEVGIIGNLFLTNIRIAWFATNNESQNISIPWIQIESITKQNIKAGTSLLIEINKFTGGYILGYQTDQIDHCLKECNQLREYYCQNPDFGIPKIGDEYDSSYKSKLVKREEDNIEIIGTIINERKNISRNYMTSQITTSANPPDEKSQDQSQQGDIVFSSELGLAIEKPPQGCKVEDLWRIIKSNS